MGIEISRYAVRIYGGGNGDGAGRVAQIHLFNADNKMVGRVDFFQSDYNERNSSTEGELLVMSLGEGMLTSVVDLLRNEMPIYLTQQTSRDLVFLSTSQEPVGANDEDFMG